MLYDMYLMQATDHCERFLDRFMATEDTSINDTAHQDIHIFYGGLPAGIGGMDSQGRIWILLHS